MSSLSEGADAYLETIKHGGLLNSRVHYFTSIYDSLFPDGTFTKVFIDNRIDSDGQMSFDSLWFVGPKTVAECKNFMIAHSEKWDAAPIGQLRHLEVNSSNYAPGAANAETSLRVEWSNNSEITGVMVAHGDNCLSLEQIIQVYLVPAML